MRVLVVGSGAIGLWLTARLSPAGHEVALVARGPVAEVLASEGIRLVSAGRTATVHSFTLFGGIDRALRPGEFYDVAALTMKAYDVAGACDEMQAATTNSPASLPAQVICLQNGLGSEEAAAARLGAGRIIAGTLTTPVAVLGPGCIEPRKSGRGGIGLARYEQPALPPASSLDQIAGALRQAGLAVRTYADYRAMLWSKLLLNMLGNATSAILSMPPEEVYADRRLFELEYRAVREALAVMRGMGIRPVDLPGYPLRWIVSWVFRLPARGLQPVLTRLVAGGRGEKMPSMYLDLAAGRGKTEVSFLNGAVAHHGRQVGIPTPVNRVLTDVLEALSHGQVSWEEFRRRPDRLLAELKAV